MHLHITFDQLRPDHPAVSTQAFLKLAETLNQGESSPIPHFLTYYNTNNQLAHAFRECLCRTNSSYTDEAWELIQYLPNRIERFYTNTRFPDGTLLCRYGNDLTAYMYDKRYDEMMNWVPPYKLSTLQQYVGLNT